MSAETETAPDEDDIRAFLLENPEFIRKDAELFSLLAGDRHGDGVVDLAAAARDKLLAEIRQLKALNEGLVETARANLAVQSQVHMALLAMLEADTLAGLDRKLSGRVAGALGVDVLRVFIENHAPLRAAESVLGAADGLIESVLGERVERLGPIEPRFADALYGPQGARVQSEALVRLEIGERRGVLALAARDASLFTPGQGTELLSFLARALERLLARWTGTR